MVTIRSIAVTAPILWACIGCSQEPRPASAARPPLPTAVTPPGVTVISGTTCRRGEETCRLLGVKESPDPAIRERARMFAESWLKSVGNKTYFENCDDPLRDEDGTMVVWLVG